MGLNIWRWPEADSFLVAVKQLLRIHYRMFTRAVIGPSRVSFGICRWCNFGQLLPLTLISGSVNKCSFKH